MTEHTVVAEVRPARADEWRELREIRLAALQDAPDAFASKYDREAAFDEATWRERAAEGNSSLAFDDDRAPVGLAVGIREPDGSPHRRQLVAMWVAPCARGLGIAGRLVESVASWARREGATELALWVVDGNAAAFRAYERAGFVQTGESQPVLLGDPRIERRMVLEL